MQKRLIWNMLLLTLIAAACAVCLSCGGDDDDDILNDEPGGVVDNNGTPQGTAGKSSMFGYYSDNAIWLFTTGEAEEVISIGNYKRLNDLTRYDNYAFRIVDGHTIYRVYEVVTTEQPKDGDYVVVNTKTYSAKTSSVTLYHIIYNSPEGSLEWVGRYAMQGDKMIVSNEEGETYQWTYSDGKIVTQWQDFEGYGHKSTEGKRTYVKVR